MRVLNSGSPADSRRTLALVLAGGNGKRLHGLTRNRTKPAVPFGGHHRIVDYALSNCVNSAIPDIAVLTQYKAQSLIRHLQRNWFPAMPANAPIEIWPAQQRDGPGWYAGTADAVHQNRDLIESIDPDDVLIVAGDHVYEMDYATLMQSHARTGADVTISCVEVPASQCSEFGIVEVDDRLKLAGFVEKPATVDDRAVRHGHVLASMGIYLFSTDFLLHCLEVDARDPDSTHDFGHSVLPRAIGNGNVYVSLFRTRDGKAGYWRDVGTIDSYWLAHQELLESQRLDGPTRADWPLHGAPRAAAPALLTPTASVAGSSVGASSMIAGSVDWSVVSTGCEVQKGAVVTESVLLPGVIVGRNCSLSRVIVDSDCRVPDNTVLDARYLGASEAFHVSPGGVMLVTDEGLRRHAAGQGRKTPRRTVASPVLAGSRLGPHAAPAVESAAAQDGQAAAAPAGKLAWRLHRQLKVRN